MIYSFSSICELRPSKGASAITLSYSARTLRKFLSKVSIFLFRRSTMSC